MRAVARAVVGVLLAVWLTACGYSDPVPWDAYDLATWDRLYGPPPSPFPDPPTWVEPIEVTAPPPTGGDLPPLPGTCVLDGFFVRPEPEPPCEVCRASDP
jgi:hypothetical protein